MGKSKLTEQQVAEIRRQYQAGIRPKLIILGFGISRKTLWTIVNGRTHKSTK